MSRGSGKRSVLQVNVDEEANKFFDDASLCPSGSPHFVLLLGGVCTGKTTLRRQHYGTGYVVIDAADIFLNLSRGEYFDFPSVLEEPMDRIGRVVAAQAFAERRHIVTEMIGEEAEPIKVLIDAVLALGYEVDPQFLTCELE